MTLIVLNNNASIIIHKYLHFYPIVMRKSFIALVPGNHQFFGAILKKMVKPRACAIKPFFFKIYIMAK